MQIITLERKSIMSEYVGKENPWKIMWGLEWRVKHNHIEQLTFFDKGFYYLKDLGITLGVFITTMHTSKKCNQK
jgi:hypothetical protein